MFIGEGDRHNPQFDDTKIIIPLSTFEHNETANVPGHCVYSFHLYLSSTFELEEEGSNLTLICVIALTVVFLIMAGVFYCFDRFIRRRNQVAISEAARSNALVSSLFPENVKERLFAERDKTFDDMQISSSHRRASTHGSPGSSAKHDVGGFKSRPIADLFPDTTILFADIVGFTAWSSVREPTQVFILLETIYRAFDNIAKKRRVFKVETIGDCYVAVTGLPEARKDHALAMARFANDCMICLRWLVKKLEVKLGPDTGDLSMRIGMHSGPVTAGVLRGERSRFQLFGDTMNTAARMESNGIRDKIQVSQDTADLLIAAGKANWLTQRSEG